VGRFAVNRALPERGRPREEVLAELAAVAAEEDAFWETGKCSGTMYCGDHEHYQSMTEALGRFAHVNPLQRDMCPSMTKFEGEIIATLDVLNAAYAYHIWRSIVVSDHLRAVGPWSDNALRVTVLP
jgi:sphinganine-1-phosphate aldolase